MQEGLLNQIDDLLATGSITGENHLSESAMELYDFLTDTQDLANGHESPNSLLIFLKQCSRPPGHEERQKLLEFVGSFCCGGLGGK